MRMNRFRNPSLPRRRHASFKDAIGCDWRVRLVAGETPASGTLPPPVGREHLSERLGQHHLSVLVALSSTNPDHAAFAIQVRDLQAGYFGYTQSCAVHGGQHRPVLQVSWRFEQSLNFGLAKNNWELLFVPRQRNPVDLDPPV